MGDVFDQRKKNRCELDSVVDNQTFMINSNLYLYSSPLAEYTKECIIELFPKHGKTHSFPVGTMVEIVNVDYYIKDPE